MGDMYLNFIPRKWVKWITLGIYLFIAVCVVLTANWLVGWHQLDAWFIGVGSGLLLSFVLEYRFRFVEKFRDWFGWD